MCNGGSQKVKQEVKLPWYQEATGRTLYQRGTTEAAKPYTAFPGSRVAPLTAEQEGAYRGTIQNLNSWGPLFGAAQTATQQGGQSWIDPGVIDSYINPYQKSATDVAARELERNFGVQERLRRGRMAEMGAWGGSQAGVADAASQRNFLQEVSDLYATGADRAYGQGLQAFQGDRAAKQQTGGSLANLAQLLPQLQRNDIIALEAVGQARQSQAQRELDDQVGRFTEARDWDKNQLSWLASLMGQTPSPTSTTQTGGGSSTAGQVLGGIQSLGSLGLLGAMAF